MTSNHIQEMQYHQYLDNDLDLVERGVIEKHIVECQKCRQELAALQHLFVAIESVPDTNLQIDLSQNILDAIGKPASLSWRLKLAIAFQLAVASALTVIAWPSLSPSIAYFEFPTINTDIFPLLMDMSTQFSKFVTAMSHSFAGLLDDMATSSSQLLLGDASVFILPLAISATLLWLVGNGILLRITYSETT